MARNWRNSKMDGETIARVKSTGWYGNYSDTITYLHHDHLGSAVAGTDEAGAILWTEKYTTYGISLVNDAANDNQAGFTGHIKDSDTGLTYMQARYYDPVVGRFLSHDPVQFSVETPPMQFNRYAYTWNNPVNFWDPFGEYTDCASFADAGSTQTCVELSNVTGKEFDTFDEAAEAAGSAIVELTETTGNEFAVAFSRNDAGKVVPTVAVSGLEAKDGGWGKSLKGSPSTVSTDKLVSGTDNVIGAGHTHPDKRRVDLDNMPSERDAINANRYTTIYGEFESVVFAPSGYPQQTSGKKMGGSYGYKPSNFKTKPANVRARERF